MNLLIEIAGYLKVRNCPAPSLDTRPLWYAALAATFGVAVFFAPQLQAAKASDISLQERLAGCAQFVADDQRLQCVDTIIASLSQSANPDKGEQPMTALKAVAIAPATADLAPEPVAESEKPELGEKYLRQQVINPERAQEHSVQYQLVHAYRDRKKRWTFEFENGEIWRQTEARYLPQPEEYPSLVTISEGVFGSHDLESDYIAKTVKVRRLR